MEIRKLEALINRSNSGVDESLRTCAEDYLRAGSTIYEESVASSTVRGDPRGVEWPAQVAHWLNSLEALHISSRSLPAPQSSTSMPRSSVGLSNPAATRPSSSDEPDGDSDVKVELMNRTLETGYSAFHKDDYVAAERMLHESLHLTQSLTVKQRRNLKCDLLKVHFLLAVCAYYLYERSVAEAALLSVIEQLSNTDEQSQNSNGKSASSLQHAEDLWTSGFILAKLYIQDNKLDLAYTTCENSYQARRRLLDRDNPRCHESMALLSRICTLQGNQARAQVYAEMIPPFERGYLCMQMSLINPLVGLAASQVAPSNNGGHHRGKEVKRRRTVLKGHHSFLTVVAFSPDDRYFVSGSLTGEICIWDVSTTSLQHNLRHRGRVEDIAFSPDGAQLAIASFGPIVRIHDARNSSLISELPVESVDYCFGTSVAFSSDGKFLVIGHGHEIRIFNLQNPEAHKKAYKEAAFETESFICDIKYLCQNSMLAVVCLFNNIALYDVSTANIRKKEVELETRGAIAISPDGNSIAFEDYGQSTSVVLPRLSIYGV